MFLDISPIIIPGIIGAIYCACDRPYTANIIWSFSNLIMAIRSYMLGDVTVAASYAVFEVFAVFGVAQHVYYSQKKKSKSV